MIKLKDVKLEMFPYPVREIVRGTLENDLERIDNTWECYTFHNKTIAAFDFLEEVFSAEYILSPNSLDTIRTGLEIWLKEHQDYLNCDGIEKLLDEEIGEKMIVIKDKKGYDIHIETFEIEPALIIVFDGENKVTFSQDYYFQPISSLIEDFEKTIAYKDSL